MGPTRKKPDIDWPYLNKLQDGTVLKRALLFLLDHPLALISGALVFIGIILSLFHIHLGGAFIGLGFAFCFFEEIRKFLKRLKEIYSKQGAFKNLVWVAGILYFLLAVPAFVISCAVGFGIIFLMLGKTPDP